MNPEFVRILDFQDGLIRIYHYEFASNFNLIGRTTRHKPARPPSGTASAPSRYAGIDEGHSSPSGSGFFMRKGDEK